MNTYYFTRQEAEHLAVQKEVENQEQSATDDLILSVSAFNNETDKVPQQYDRTWADLCRRLSQSQLRQKKLGAQTWSPTKYKPGFTRSNNGIESISCAVIDVEHHGPFDDIRARLEGYAYLTHSSFRHTAEDPRYRIILPLVTPSPANQWLEHWTRINHWLGEINDPQTSDPARIYFIPCHPNGSEPFCFIEQGKTLDVTQLPELPEDMVIARPKESMTHRSFHCIQIEGIEYAEPELNPERGLNEVIERCSFMQIVSDPANQSDVDEPLWSAMISNACRFQKSEKWIHQASCHHAGYDEAGTDNRIERFRNNYAPITCHRIRSLGFGHCPERGCCLPSRETTKAPAGLWVWLLKLPIELPFGQAK